VKTALLKLKRMNMFIGWSTSANPAPEAATNCPHSVLRYENFYTGKEMAANNLFAAYTPNKHAYLERDSVKRT
jgi:hypothetical protein